MLRPDTWSVALLSVYEARKFSPCVGSRRRLVWSESYHDCATENVGRTSEYAGIRRAPWEVWPGVKRPGLISMKIGSALPRDPT